MMLFLAWSVRSCEQRGKVLGEVTAVRKSDFIHHHHHPEGVVYRSFCLNSSTFAVSEIASGRWWCIESLFPAMVCRALWEGGIPAATPREAPDPGSINSFTAPTHFDLILVILSQFHAFCWVNPLGQSLQGSIGRRRPGGGLQGPRTGCQRLSGHPKRLRMSPEGGRRSGCGDDRGLSGLPGLADGDDSGLPRAHRPPQTPTCFNNVVHSQLVFLSLSFCISVVCVVSWPLVFPQTINQI